MTAVAALAKLTRLQALGLVVILWAGIYLPALGSLEIKGEEGRRILPGAAMLDTGEWIVPTVGGVPFYNKPPLVNWLAAASFRVAGNRSEWAARAPSVLLVLALGLTTVASLSGLLTPPGALLAAIFALTNIGLMEKGRLAEIEAVYLSLSGIAVVLWLGAWHAETVTGRRTPVRTWVLPWVVLGLGLLAKGPLHLFFFYAVIVAVLQFSGRLRELFRGAHLAGLGVMLGIFAAWAVPYLHRIDAGRVGGVWYTQMAGRMEVHENFRVGFWLLNAPRGLVNFLPWTVLLPLAWRRPLPSITPGGDDLPRHFALAIARGLRWALVVSFVVVSYVPGGQPRYTLPLLTPASVLLALTFVLDRRWAALPALPTWLPVVWARVVAISLSLAIAAAPVAAALGGNRAWRWVVASLICTAGLWLLRGLWHRPTVALSFPALGTLSALTMVLLTADYAVGAVPRLRRTERVRLAGHQINEIARGDGPIAVFQPGFVPFLFYLGSRPLYLLQASALTPAMQYLLVREGDLDTVEPVMHTHGFEYRIALRVNDKRLNQDPGAQWLLLHLIRAQQTSL